MNLKDIEHIQAVIKKDIHRSYDSKDISRAVKLIDCFADVTQRINNILRDDDVEGVIKQIADNYIDSSSDIKDGGDPKTVVMFDQIGTTTCLGLQYLRGLAADGYKIIYIYESHYYSARISDALLEEAEKLAFKTYKFHTYDLYDGKKFVAQEIRDAIISHNPSKIIVHPQGSGALGMAVLSSIKGAEKFRIVPGDHHFYLGYDCFDHFIEFRPFGWSTAVYERKIPAEKIFNLNYYPIIDEFTPFAGFPEGTQGKVILGAGGSTYKFEGSSFFADAVERILTESKDAVLVFMGKPDSRLQELSRKESMSGRIFFLGYRNDFSAVISHIDILFNSYPFSGGLFCQTAAYFGKPILAYASADVKAENAVESIFGGEAEFGTISVNSTDEFFKHAYKLVNDEQYRSQNGDTARSLLQTKDNFDRQLGMILEGQQDSLAAVHIDYVDRSERIQQYIKIRSAKNPDHLFVLARTYGLKSFFTFPFLSEGWRHNAKQSLIYSLSSYPLMRKFLKR